jgi:hypothetical protein
MVEGQDWALSCDEWAEGLTFAPGPALRIGFLRGRYEVTKDLPDDAERRVRSGVNSGAKHSGVRRRREHLRTRTQQLSRYESVLGTGVVSLEKQGAPIDQPAPVA